MVVGNHLFSFFDKKFREGVTRYESHPPSLRTVYFPTAPFLFLLLLFYFGAAGSVGSQVCHAGILIVAGLANGAARESPIVTVVPTAQLS